MLTPLPDKSFVPLAAYFQSLWPFWLWLFNTWVGNHFLKPAMTSNSALGTVMRYRDQLFAKRLEDIENNNLHGRVDILQGLAVSSSIIRKTL